MPYSTEKNSVIIVGAGLAGCLMAIFLARRGYSVELYERRPDLRDESSERCRSINMTLAERGLRALEEVGLLQSVLDLTVTVKGRMVHEVNGAVNFQPYGKNEKEVIHAVMRRDLNIALMNHAETFPNVKIHFRRPCARSCAGASVRYRRRIRSQSPRDRRCYSRAERRPMQR